MLQSMGAQRVGHDWATTTTTLHWDKYWAVHFLTYQFTILTFISNFGTKCFFHIKLQPHKQIFRNIFKHRAFKLAKRWEKQRTVSLLTNPALLHVISDPCGLQSCFSHHCTNQAHMGSRQLHAGPTCRALSHATHGPLTSHPGLSSRCWQALVGIFLVFVQLLSHVQLFVTPWTAARQAALSITNSQSFLKLLSIESLMPSNHLILCHPLLLLPLIFPSIRVFSSELALCSRWPKFWSFSISPSNEYSGLISFRIDCSDLLAVQSTLKSLLQHHKFKNNNILRRS